MLLEKIAVVVLLCNSRKKRVGLGFQIAASIFTTLISSSNEGIEAIVDGNVIYKGLRSSGGGNSRVEDDMVGVISWSGETISDPSAMNLDISNSVTVADLVSKELHGLTSNFSFFSEEIAGDDEANALSLHAETNYSHCSFMGSNAPISPLNGDCALRGGGGPIISGDVRMTEGPALVFGDKQARMYIQSLAEAGSVVAMLREFPQQGMYCPIPPTEPSETLFLQRGDCNEQPSRPTCL